MMVCNRLKSWVWIVVLSVPVLIPYLIHFYDSGARPGQIPTGFIQYDQPYYMANAREIFESDGIPFAYANPNYDDYESPKIYFQVHIWVLGFIHWITDWDPGVVYLVFGLFGIFLSLRMCWLLFEKLWGFTTKRDYVVFCLFVWGGGIMSIMGMCSYFYDLYALGRPDDNFYKYLVKYDPEDGWWFLNFGRNLVYPTEAYYHALFLGGVLCVVCNRIKMSLWLGLALSFSHPFTGVQYLLILFAWLFVERYFWRNNTIKVPYIFGAALLILVHLLYYKLFLSSFDSHREIEDIWALDWSYKADSIIGAYIIVGFLALTQMCNWELFQKCFSDYRNRLFAVWFFIAFVLANHEFLFPPIQPLHFTRGYVWIPLFLLGAPALRQIFAVWRTRLWTTVGGSLLIIVLLLDNFFWITMVAPLSTTQTVKLEPEEYRALRVINRIESKQHIVIADRHYLNYLVSVYTNHRPFVGHVNITPQREMRSRILAQIFNSGHIPEVFKERNIIIAISKMGKPRAVIEKLRASALRLGMEIRQVSSVEDDYVVLEILKAGEGSH